MIQAYVQLSFCDQTTCPPVTMEAVTLKAKEEYETNYTFLMAFIALHFELAVLLLFCVLTP